MVLSEKLDGEDVKILTTLTELPTMQCNCDVEEQAPWRLRLCLHSSSAKKLMQAPFFF